MNNHTIGYDTFLFIASMSVWPSCPSCNNTMIIVSPKKSYEWTNQSSKHYWPKGIGYTLTIHQKWSPFGGHSKISQKLKMQGKKDSQMGVTLRRPECFELTWPPMVLYWILILVINDSPDCHLTNNLVKNGQVTTSSHYPKFDLFFKNVKFMYEDKLLPIMLLKTIIRPCTYPAQKYKYPSLIS